MSVLSGKWFVSIEGIYLLSFLGDLMFTYFDMQEAAFETGIGVIWIAGIVAPTVEEVVFREVLLKYINDKKYSIIISLLLALVRLFN
ncbi:CPBP family glutamic-type intramembrane protease [Staphylococcus delphini]|uniref:CPBP family glutamic-type intramembrane protease n=2 Tax=Staphylococcus delphini TaxID=53344 RepID=UPI0021D37B92|nr:CPBP family glutamic-type intramembrane protease [Staphylococcus delphini]UXS21739.1 hypothetical protein MUA22_00445 [Staphylococcus delphini]